MRGGRVDEFKILHCLVLSLSMLRSQLKSDTIQQPGTHIRHLQHCVRLSKGNSLEHAVILFNRVRGFPHRRDDDCFC